MTTEHERIQFLLKRDGLPATGEWVARTLEIYRRALLDPNGHAATPAYRPLFEQAVRDYEEWLGESGKNKT